MILNQLHYEKIDIISKYFLTTLNNLTRTKQIKKYQDQITFIENNYKTWVQFKKLSGSTIICYLKQAFTINVCQSTIYNWIKQGWLQIKSAMVFKKGYKKPKKVVKKWQKTVFNPDFYQPFNIYRKQVLQN